MLSLLLNYFLPLTKTTAEGFEMQTSYTLKSPIWGFLDYTYAPAIGLFYLLALVFGLCTLQEAATLSLKRRSLVVLSMLIIALSYVLEALFYVGQKPTDDDRSTPQHAIFRALSVAPVWTALAVYLSRTRVLLWNPYVGVFVLGFLFESITTTLLLATRGYLDTVSLCLSIARPVVTLALLINGILIVSFCRIERHSNEEAQPLLRHSNADTPPQQQRRLTEPGNWIKYIQRFAIFMPHLLPWHDSKILCSLAIRIVIAILNRGINVALPRQLGIAIDKLSSEPGTMPWKEIASWTCYLWLDSRAGLNVLDSLASTCIHNSSYKQITNLAMGHVMDLSFNFHSDKDTGEILKAIDQAESLNNLVQLIIFEIIPIVIDFIIAIGYVTHLFNIYLTSVIFGISATYISLGIVINPWIQRKQRILTENSRSENKVAYEAVSNWLTITYFDRTQFEKQRYGGVVQDFIDVSYSYLYRLLCGHAAQDLIMTAGFAGCTSLAMLQVTTGQKSIGSLITFITYWNAIKGTAKRVTGSYQTISSTLVNAERLLQLLYTEPSVTDAESSKELVVNAGEVRFKDVSFAYDTRKPLIKKLDLIAEAGKTVAIVGETGGGKSTILNLLLRLYDVCEGSITIDGQDVRNVELSSLRKAIGIVPQSPVLFNRSILENVRYGRLDATDEEIIDACKATAIHKKIMEFPDDYETKVGEGGVRLSGGELQRLAIARVLLKNPKIVILDEATSAVDTLTEAQIQKAFQRLSSGRTVFVIAHRLSTITRADKILVVCNGEIVESGTHDELLAKGREYNKLWRQQISGIA